MIKVVYRMDTASFLCIPMLNTTEKSCLTKKNKIEVDHKYRNIRIHLLSLSGSEDETLVVACEHSNENFVFHERRAIPGLSESRRICYSCTVFRATHQTLLPFTSKYNFRGRFAVTVCSVLYSF